MKIPRSTGTRQLRPSICKSTIAVAALMLAQVGSFAPSASATTFGPVEVPFGTQLFAPLLTDATGLTMSGGGLLLLNPGNTYTGTTTINDGSVSITAASALGADTSAINIAGLPLNGQIFDATRGGGGGNLTVGGGITFSRGLNLRGLGPSGDTGALTSVGNNTFTGAISTGTGASARIVSNAGTATFSGPVTVGAGTTLQFTGNGNMLLGGNIGATTGGVQRIQGGGLLEITGTNLYSGITTLNGGFLRVSDQSNIGTNTGNSAITLTSGTLEIRTDAGSFATKGLANTGNASVFVDHAVGSAVQNHTVTLRTLALTANVTMTLNGRNGYGMTFNGMIGGNLAGNSTISNNLKGMLTYNGNFWNQTNTTARTFTLSGTGDSLVNGNIQATGAAHSITKSGSGTLSLLATGSGSNIAGNINISGGTLAVNSITALNNAATGAGGQINIGSGTTGGTLAFVGSGAAGDYVVAKTVNLSGTSGGATIAANQIAASPVVIGVLDATGAGTRTLTLAGSSTQENRISGDIADSLGTTSLAKSGSGTWALSGTNDYRGNTTINDGTLKIMANGAVSTVLPDRATASFATNGGTFEFVGQDGVNNVEVVGQLIPTAGAGTVRLTPGAGGTASLVFEAIAFPLPGLGTVNSAASVNFIVPALGGVVRLWDVATGFVDPHLYFNGADFAHSNEEILEAPAYGTTPGFSTSATALTTGNHNEITGSFATGGSAASDTIRSLKISGSRTVTLAGILTINSEGFTTGATSAGGIIQTGGSSSIAGLVGGAISTGTAGNLVIRVDAVSDRLDLGVPIVATSGGLTKNGAGTLSILATNAQTGQTTINEGQIVLSLPAGRLSGSNAALVIRRNAELDLNGVDTGTSISSLNGEGIITNSHPSALAAVLTVGNGNGSGTFSGVIQDGAGQIRVIKQGTSAQTWSGTNTYTGSTTINSTGLVAVTALADGGVPSSIGASSGAAGNLVFGGASATGATGGINYTGSATVSTDRLFTLAANAANSGGRIQANGANNAAVIFSNMAPIAITGTAAQTLTLGGASNGDNRMNVRLVDGPGAAILSLRKDDGGLWILGNATNSYSGTTLIVNGPLEAVPGALGAGGLILGTGATGVGVFQSSGDFSRSIGTGAGTVSWGGAGGGGGFAASTEKFNVNIGSAAWGVGSFVTNGVALVLNSSSALSEVDYRSGIALNGASRTIQVDDNGNTASDFATISGVITGAGASSGLIKTGAGLLNLTGTNGYEGNTQIRQGTVNVTSLGNANGIGTSGLGAWGGNTVDLGFNNLAATLAYVGTGETSSRTIRATGTSGTTTVIRSNGTGALVLTNLVNTPSGAAGRTIALAGENTGPNEVTNVLADNGGPLTIAKNDGGLWIMNAAHTFSGGTRVTFGILGLGSDAAGSAGAVTSGPLGTGTLTLSGGSLMALNGDRTILNDVSVSSGVMVGYMGENSLIIDAPIVVGAGNATTGYQNFITAGKALVINGQFSHDDVNNKTQIFRGSGDTIINGLITQTNTGNFGLQIEGTAGGSLKISGTAGPNTYGGPTNLNGETLILDKVGAIANTGTASILNLNGGTLQVSSDANGAITNATLLNGNPTTFSGSSTVNLQGSVTVSGGGRLLTNNISGGGKELVLSGTVSLSEGNTGRTLALGGTGNTTISGLIQNGGSGAGVLTKTGLGTVFITGTANTYSGSTIINGGVLNVASLANGETNSSIGRAGIAATLLTLNGGTLQYTGASPQSTNKLLTVGAGGGSLDSSGAAPLNFTGTGNIVASGTGTRTLTLGGTNTGNNIFRPLLAVSTVSTLNLIKDGPGKWILTGPNTYNGTTTINDGTLLVGNVPGGGGASIASSTVVVNGGTFGGTGQLGAITATSGVVSPGNSIGTLTAVSLTMNGFASFKLELDTAAAPGLQNDRLNLSGVLSLETAVNGGSPLNISELGLGAALPAGTTLPFITFVGSQTGFFSVSGNLITDELEAFIVGLNTFQIDYDNGGNQVALKVVPEPGVVTSLITGFGLLLGARRRRAGHRA